MTALWLAGGAAIATFLAWELRRALQPGGSVRTLLGQRHETTIYHTPDERD